MSFTAAKAKEIRNSLKVEFPGIKFSVSVEYARSINIRIKSGDSDSNLVEAVDRFVNKETKYRETGDYGMQPNWYLWIYDERIMP